MERPGAKAEVYVESQCEDGQLCEDRLRIKLQYGDTALTLLLSIWVINEVSLNDCKCIFILLLLSMKKYSPAIWISNWKYDLLNWALWSLKLLSITQFGLPVELFEWLKSISRAKRGNKNKIAGSWAISLIYLWPTEMPNRPNGICNERKSRNYVPYFENTALHKS